MTSAEGAESVYFVNPGTLPSFLFTAAALASERSGARTPRELQGMWVGEVGGRNVILELRGCGTYVLAGVEGGWSGGAGWLELDDQPLEYRREGDHLWLRDRSGREVKWTRA